VVTLVVALGGDSSKVVSSVGGVAALRKAAQQIRGVWPRNLPQADPAGQLPRVEWAPSTAENGRVAWMMPRGWTTTEAARKPDAAAPSMMSFNAPAGTGGFSITASTGLAAASPDQLAAAEERVIRFLLAQPVTTRADGWTCGEGIEKASGLPAIVCNQTTRQMSLYVSLRAEPAVFHTLGGVASVRSAALRVRGFSY
jgi:hypothetical protein